MSCWPRTSRDTGGIQLWPALDVAQPREQPNEIGERPAQWRSANRGGPRPLVGHGWGQLSPASEAMQEGSSAFGVACLVGGHRADGAWWPRQSVRHMDYPFTREQICLIGLARTSWARRATAKRHALSFGEESITETILMDLAESFPGDIMIVPFNKRQEGKTGADWAWAFQDARSSWNLPILVQAKALDNNEQKYSEMKRYVGRTKKSGRQIDLLMQTARQFGWPSIYAFYNYLTDHRRLPNSCGTLGSSKTMPQCWGISVANSYNVRAALDDQSFDRHSRHSRPLHCLLCSGARGHRGKWGSPGLALAALRRLRGDFVDAHALPDAPALPDEPFRELPSLFQRAREIAATQRPRQRELLRRTLAREFPTLAGVVLLRDAAEPS